MKLATVTGIVSRNGGGVAVVVQKMGEGMVRYTPITNRVFSSFDFQAKRDVTSWQNVDVVLEKNMGMVSVGFPWLLKKRIQEYDPDIVHLHGLWHGVSYIAKSYSNRIISLHGMLNKWALDISSFKKKIALHCFERENLQGSKCLHALNEDEYDAIRAFGLSNPVCIIPNGVDLPGENECCPPWGDFGRDEKILLFLGRIHPIKGLVSLIKAWHVMGEARKQWRLVIVGWDQLGHLAELRQMVSEYSLEESVRFLGPQFGTDKMVCYEAADAFVLPSVSEGLPMVVLEAWTYGLPVVMTSKCNLTLGFDCGAAYRIPLDVSGIAEKMKEFLDLDDSARREMGRLGKQLVLDKYSWGKITKEFYTVYRWLNGDGKPPSCVIFD